MLPFLSSILFAAIVAYIFHPFYERLNHKNQKRSWNALIISVVIVLLFTVPVFFLIKSVTSEVNQLYISAKTKLQGGAVGAEMLVECGKDETLICNLLRGVNRALRDPRVKDRVNVFLVNVLQFMSKATSEIILGVPKLFIGIAVSIFSTFYFLRDGKLLIGRLRRVIPLRLNHQEQLFSQLDNIVYAVVYGAFVIALIQGSLASIAYFIIGVPSPVFWSVITSFFALIPVIGTAPIWGLISASFVLLGIAQNDSVMITKGLSLAVYGVLVISTIDNFLRPSLIGERAKVHPLIILFGVFGGLATFGFVGFILGPIVLALFKTMFDMYEREALPHVRK